MKTAVQAIAVALFGLGAAGAAWVAVDALAVLAGSCDDTAAGCTAARAALGRAGLLALLCLGMARLALRGLGRRG